MSNHLINKKVLAVITARGGSKGLVNKNILELCGKPLIAWTIENALQSKFISKLVVSTDSKEISLVSKQYGAEVPFERPLALASDDASSVDVAIHALKFYEDQGICFDYLLLLEPTSPLRELTDIDQSLQKLFAEKELDALVTIGELHPNPMTAKKILGNKLVNFIDSNISDARRQDLDVAYAPFGGIYVIKTDVLKLKKTFYPSNIGFYKIKRYQCYEIDDIYDFLSVENILKNKKEGIL